MQAYTDPIFKELGILKFNDIHLLQLGQFMYSCKNSLLSPRFNNNFSQAINYTPTFTIQEILWPTVYRIVEQTLRGFRLYFKDLIFFNSLDNEVINSQSLSSFKKILKIKSLSKYENSSQIFPSSTFRHLFFN